ncbi:hypothetical protein HDU93_001054 [Gonapodya sp. JEL0774]|nr:hypothetical protein HDU93_001054 [Gonapodya sp. JEL0774]
MPAHDDAIRSEIATEISAGIELDTHVRDIGDLYSGLHTVMYHDPPYWAPLKRQKVTPLPEGLFEQYEGGNLAKFRSLESDLFMFEDQDQVILSVALVKPLQGVFIDTVEYLLVVATPLEIFILGVAFGDSPPTAERWKGPLILYKTQMSASCEEVTIISIKGTGEGRIFMGGSNGRLYELVYQLYYLGQRRRQVQQIATLRDGELIRAVKALQPSLDTRSFRIIAVDPILLHHSKRLHAVVTTSTGITEIVKQRPIDSLLELFQEATQTGNFNKIGSFFQSSLDGRLTFTLSVDEALDAEMQLDSLSSAIGSDLSVHRADTHAPIANGMEAQIEQEKWVAGVRQLAATSSEVLELTRILRVNNLSGILERLSESDKQTFETTAFAEIAVGLSERSRQLVAALFRALLETGVAKDELKERCPLLFSAQDTLLLEVPYLEFLSWKFSLYNPCVFKAQNLLSKARSAPSTTREEFLIEAVRLLKELPRPISKDELLLVVDELQSSGFANGAVEVALWRAQKVDPTDAALDCMRDVSGVSQVSKEAYDRRMECYAIILKVISESLTNGPNENLLRLPAFQRAIVSDDILLQFYLYDWLLNGNYTHVLLKMPSNSLELYLKSNTTVPKKLLLWQYLVQQRDYREAARTLCDLAETPNEGVNLKSRIEYLSSALASLRSSMVVDPHAAALADEINEKLEVANIQNQILQALRSRVEVGTLSDESRHIEALDSSLHSISLKSEDASIRRLNQVMRKIGGDEALVPLGELPGRIPPE